MSCRLTVQPEAEAELADAFRWYERQREGLGREFLTSIEACLASILRAPESYSAVHKHVRRAVIRRFPYSVLYVIEERAVVIVAVFHASRDPKRRRERV
ncbi:MAG TPA: type II toxin-antitoxin system RelE/ParE family toxin [Phycisphaerae bacterium]|nr:type II toxin-antitoxin system RelE/ParE family toxin [Phycisphaerae bacterium]